MIYLNNAATSWPKPPVVSEAMANWLGNVPNHGSRATNGAMSEEITCRQRLADLFQIQDPGRIAYMENATHGLNAAILGYPWKTGSRVLTTAAEHNSVLRPLHLLQKKGILTYEVLPVLEDGRLDIDAYEKALKAGRTDMVAITHASNVTGGVNDISRIAKMAKEQGAAVLVDASQTAGLLPVLPQLWEVDLLAFTGHKYLLGPTGTGGLYVRPGLFLKPVLAGGTGFLSQEAEMPEEMPYRLEAGTPNDMGFCGLGAAIQWQKEHPLEREGIEQKVKELEEALFEMELKVCRPNGSRTPVLAFSAEEYEPDEIGMMLLENQEIICRTGLHCAPLLLPYVPFGPQGSVRISLSRFTTQEEIEILIGGIRAIVCE